MAEGIRIHHPNPEVWGQTVIVPHPGDPRSGRKPKDYHIRLDSDGNCIVSATVWRRLEEARGCGLSPHKFTVVNVVGEPPTQVMGGRPESRRLFRQEQEALREIAPNGVKPRVVRQVVSPRQNKRDPKTDVN